MGHDCINFWAFFLATSPGQLAASLISGYLEPCSPLALLVFLRTALLLLYSASACWLVVFFFLSFLGGPEQSSNPSSLRSSRVQTHSLKANSTITLYLINIFSPLYVLAA